MVCWCARKTVGSFGVRCVQTANFTILLDRFRLRILCAGGVGGGRGFGGCRKVLGLGDFAWGFAMPTRWHALSVVA